MLTDVYIRSDGSPEVGLGHLVRCLALAHMLKKHFNVTFFCKSIPEQVAGQIENGGFILIRIQSEQEFIDHIRKIGIVVLDGYHFDTEYQQRVKASGCLLICIDDLHDKYFVADAVINPAPGLNKDVYSTQPHTQFLLGPEYALLRPAFISQANKERSLPDLDHIFINFGGSDAKNLTITALRCVLLLSKVKKVKIVTGTAYPYKHLLEIVIKQHPEVIEHLHDLQEDEMKNAILDSSLAIIPSSGILFEVIACRTPCISGYSVQNQFDIYNGFKSKAVFYDAQNFTEVQIQEALDRALKCSPREQMENQKLCIDGKSPFRFNKFFADLNYNINH